MTITTGDAQVTFGVLNTGGLDVDGFFVRADDPVAQPTQNGTRTGNGQLTVATMTNRLSYRVWTQLKNADGAYGPASRQLLITPFASGTSDLDVIRLAIKAELNQVTNMGKVHEFERHTTFWDKYIREHSKKGHVNDWEITRVARAQDISALENLSGNEPFFHDLHRIKIRGRMGLKDAKETEKTFQQIVDDIALRIRLNTTLNGSVLLPRQAQVPVIGHRTFGGVLCHYAEVDFEAIVRVGG